VGFATWDAPEREGNDEELEAMKHWAPDPPPAALDAEAFRELRRIVDADAKAVIGDEAKKTWSRSSLRTSSFTTLIPLSSSNNLHGGSFD
jgi:hypothetical protein